jgi:hypothetical protein
MILCAAMVAAGCDQGSTTKTTSKTGAQAPSTRQSITPPKPDKGNKITPKESDMPGKEKSTEPDK